MKRRTIPNPDQQELFTPEQLLPTARNIPRQRCMNTLAILMKDVPLPKKKQRRSPYY